ncbi:MAG: DNA repair protein RadA [candidate division NC10 bacterium]|nr:DNA repair protein RadA [candidate division NC10 bacterium]
MASRRSHFECQQCGHQAPRWLGRCPDCGRWGSLIEVRALQPVGSEGPPRGRRAPADLGPPAVPIPLAEVAAAEPSRTPTGLSEFDRVLGGGLVPGAVVLVGGEPGVGKSTLLLQVAASVAQPDHPVLYVTGEESPAQAGSRARRLGAARPGLYLLAETSLEAILAQAEALKPALLILDSVQTTWSPALESSAGSVSQVREVAGRLLEAAKARDFAVFLIGHVTKEGSLAGPKTLEHIVDTVVAFEGDRHQPHRILRASKNRFGPTDEIGLFEMRVDGLVPVENPSALFLAERPDQVAGSVVVATVEGTRPLLLELQALVAPTGAPVPRRVANGLDFQRVAMLLAVVEKRLAIRLGASDVFLNIVGGLQVREPAADLGVVAAVLSSVRDVPVPRDWALFGEVGLAGEIRAVPQTERRLAELSRLGFRRAVTPRSGAERPAGMEVVGVSHVDELAALVGHSA